MYSLNQKSKPKKWQRKGIVIIIVLFFVAILLYINKVELYNKKVNLDNLPHQSNIQKEKNADTQSVGISENDLFKQEGESAFYKYLAIFFSSKNNYDDEKLVKISISYFFNDINNDKKKDMLVFYLTSPDMGNAWKQYLAFFLNQEDNDFVFQTSTQVGRREYKYIDLKKALTILGNQIYCTERFWKEGDVNCRPTGQRKCTILVNENSISLE